jgi:4-alpha-glucanotransferase
MTKKQPCFDERVHRYWQFEFDRQWSALARYCRERDIRIMGDLPIYVARDSSDVANHPELFRDDVVAGVPPDYFSATGQLWGNPPYAWRSRARRRLPPLYACSPHRPRCSTSRASYRCRGVPV